MLRLLLVFMTALALAWPGARPLDAHSSGLAAIHATRSAVGWTVEARLPAEDLLAVVRPGTAPSDDLRRELEPVKSEVVAYVGGRLELFESGQRLEPTSIELSDYDHTRAKITIRVTTGPGAVTIASRLFTELDRAYRIVMTHIDSNGKRLQSVIWPGSEPIALTSGGGAGAREASALDALVHFVWLGVEHIFTGYDHLLFLVSLLLLPTGLGRLVATVTCFTLAHSITLASAALDWWSLPSALVEPAIALSICWVAVENFFVHEARHRWLLTFLFGLIHGFGFAGSLKSIGLPPDAVVQSLLGFNLGVELGQIAIILLLYPVLRFVQRRAIYHRWLLPAGSLVILYFGLVWFLERI